MSEKEFEQGVDSVLYLGVDTATPTLNDSSLSVVAEARDVTLDQSASEVDATTKAGAGMKATVTALKDLTIEGELLYKMDNANYGILRDAFLSSNFVAAALLTGPKAHAASEGPLGRWSVTKLSQPQPLDGVQLVQFTLKLFELTDWVGATITS